jgi:mannose/fructose/N-acetylgalactosamine-specific phosphotransferase system component IIC
MQQLRLLYTLVSLLMIVLSLPLIARKVPPNPIYGFRTRRTLSDPDFWYEMNAYGGKLLLALGICLTIASFVLARVPGLSTDGYAYGFTAVLIGVGIVDAVLAVIYYRRLKADD